MLKRFLILLLICINVAAVQKSTARDAHVRMHTHTHRIIHIKTSTKKISKRALSHYREIGNASWYGKQFNHKRTSSGERFNMYALTAAHKTLPLNTIVKVTNLKNGKSVIVKINDRGPFIRHRNIDLSYAAAKKIGMVVRGVGPVSIEVVKA